MGAKLLRLTVTKNPYVPLRGGLFPSPKQAYFLTADPVLEAMYGGAAGGGKSDALLAAALQYVTEPGYAALLLRRTFADLKLPGALMDRAAEWLSGTDATWNSNDHQWVFPSGATLTFGYLENEKDKYRYQSSEFQFIGFDELTQFTRTQYTYMFSRLRRLLGSAVPLRVRSATNPGGEGHDWVSQRFPVQNHGGRPVIRDGRMFVPALMEENPGLDREAYELSLAELDPVTRAQLRAGDWNVRQQGNLFKRHWFDVIDADRVPPLEDAVRCWDLAATTAEEADDPDWLAGVKLGKVGKTYYVLHVTRDRLTPQGVEKLITRTAAVDTVRTKVRIEQEGAASGKIVRSYYTRLLDGYDARFTGIPKAAKTVRAGPFSAACERGDVKLVRGAWNETYLDELCAFPQEGVKDDQVDASTNAYKQLSGGPGEWAGAELSTVFNRSALRNPEPSPRDLLMRQLGR